MPARPSQLVAAAYRVIDLKSKNLRSKPWK